MKLMCKSRFLDDSSQNHYIGCPVTQSSIMRFLRVLRRMLGDTRYDTYREHKRKRDQGTFHITLVSPIEMPLLKNRNDPSILKQQFSATLLGIGRAQTDQNDCFYIVVESEPMQQYRQQLGLAPKDLHITLGFYPNDVYDQTKNKSTIIQPVGELPLPRANKLALKF